MMRDEEKLKAELTTLFGGQPRVRAKGMRMQIVEAWPPDRCPLTIGPYYDVQPGQAVVRYEHPNGRVEWERYASRQEAERHAAGELCQPALLTQGERATLLGITIADTVDGWRRKVATAEVTHHSWFEAVAELNMMLDEILRRASARV